MSESMFASLPHTPDRIGVSEIGNSVGEPEEPTARGMDSSIAAVLGGVMGKAEDAGAPPAGLSELFRPSFPAAGASPVVAQSFIREGGLPTWAAALGLCGAALGCFWLLTHARRQATEMGSVATGAANRLADEAFVRGEFVRQNLPNDVQLNIPAKGIESRLLVFIQDPNAVVDQTSWFDFDRLKFDSGSATLRLQSRAQLDNIAAILRAYPNVHVKIAAFTDSVVSGQRSLKLSQVRADSVRTGLLARGVSPKRVTAQGFGEQNAAADNSGARLYKSRKSEFLRRCLAIA